MAKDKLGIYVVQIINNEVICAGLSTKPTENNAQMLVHCRVNPGGNLQFTLKGKSQSEVEMMKSTYLPTFQNAMQQSGQTMQAQAADPLAGLF